MTQVASLEAQFRSSGAEKVIGDFKEIARAAAAAKREQQVAAQNMRDEARKMIPTQKEIAKATIAQQQALTNWAKNTAVNFGAAAAVVGVATKKIYDFGKSGAQLEYTRNKFDKLSRTVGATGNLFINDLKLATRGTVSDMKLAEQAANMFQLGLAKTSAEAIRLSKVQTALGMDTGELTLALANQSKKRLDQLGLSLTRFNEIEAKLKESMPNASKGEIFNEAFMLTAEETIKKTGNMADSTLGTFQKLEASAANVWDTWKVKSADAMAPDVSNFANFFKALDEVQQGRMQWAGGSLSKLLTGAGIGEILAGGPVLESKVFDYTTHKPIPPRLRGSLPSGRGNITARTYDDYGGMRDMYAAQGMTGGQAPEAPIDYDSILKGGTIITTQTQQIAEATKALNEQLKEQQANLATLNERGYSPTNAKMVETRDNIQQIRTQLEEVGKAQAQTANELMMQNIAIASSEEEKAKNQLDYALASGQMTQEAYNQQSALMGIADAFAAGKINAEQAAKMAELVMTKLLALDGMSVDAMINLVINGGGLGVTSGFGMGVGGQSVGGGGIGGNTAPPIQMQASGGPLAPISIVGDGPGGAWTPYTEVIIGNHVYGNKESKKMKDAGLLKGAQNFRVGGSLDDPTYDPGDVLVFGPTGSAKAMTSPLYTSGASGGSSSSYSVPSVAEIASTIAEPIVMGVGKQVTQQSMKLEIQVAEMTRETKKTNDLLGAIYAKVASDNGVARAVSEIGLKNS